MLRSSLYTADSFPTFTDEEGVKRPMAGFVQIGIDDAGQVVLHAQPGMRTPPGMTMVKDGRTAPWRFSMIPRLAQLRIMEAEWEEMKPNPRGGGSVLTKVRGKIADMPGSVTPSKTDLTPHLWYGEVE